jgi:hypothetical protein
MRQTVRLHALDGSTIGMMAVRVNQHGELPALIVDPKDSEGRVMAGLWLGQMVGRVFDGTTYHQIISQVPGAR